MAGYLTRKREVDYHHGNYHVSQSFKQSKMEGAAAADVYSTREIVYLPSTITENEIPLDDRGPAPIRAGQR